MSKPMIRIHNTETDEVIDREMTDEEYEFHLADLDRIAEEKRILAEKSARRAEILERLGLTEDEAKLILG